MLSNWLRDVLCSPAEHPGSGQERSVNTHTEPTISKFGNKTIVFNENKHLAVSSSRNRKHCPLVPEAGTRVSARCPLRDAPRHQHGLIRAGSWSELSKPSRCASWTSSCFSLSQSLNLLSSKTKISGTRLSNLSMRSCWGCQQWQWISHSVSPGAKCPWKALDTLGILLFAGETSPADAFSIGQSFHFHLYLPVSWLARAPTSNARWQ